MVASLATVNSIMKEVYVGRIQDQLQEECVGYKRIEGSSNGIESTVGGKYVTFPVRVQRNAGIGYRNELEALQNGGQQGYASVRVGLKYGYGRSRISGQTMDLVDSNYQAFANAMNLEMDGLKNDILKDTSRVFYGDGTGTIAKIPNSTTTANTVNSPNTQYVEVGQVVDIGTAAQLLAATPIAAARTVTSVNYATGDITVDGATFSASATSLMVRTGNYLREPNGLGSIVTSTGALFNIDPSTVPQWAAYVDSNGGTNRSLSEGLMVTDTDQVRRNGGKTSVILYSLGVRRAYFNLLSQQRRYPTTTSFAGGLTGLAFNNGREIPCVEDVDCPPNTMFGIDESSLTIYRDKPWSFMQADGDIWKWVPGFDAYEAVLYQYWEIGTNRRNANFIMKDITEG